VGGGDVPDVRMYPQFVRDGIGRVCRVTVGWISEDEVS
jgi:hypothetical protein